MSIFEWLVRVSREGVGLIIDGTWIPRNIKFFTLPIWTSEHLNLA